MFHISFPQINLIGGLRVALFIVVIQKQKCIQVSFLQYWPSDMSNLLVSENMFLDYLLCLVFFLKDSWQDLLLQSAV